MKGKNVFYRLCENLISSLNFKGGFRQYSFRFLPLFTTSRMETVSSYFVHRKHENGTRNNNYPNEGILTKFLFKVSGIINIDGYKEKAHSGGDANTNSINLREKV